MGILWHSEEHFSTLGLAMIGRDQKDVVGPVSFENEARFKAVFGTSAWMCSLIWRMLDEQTDYLDNRHARAKHLLWGLVIIKVYGNEKAMCAIVSVACLFLLSLAESLVYRQTVESDRILRPPVKLAGVYLL